MTTAVATLAEQETEFVKNVLSQLGVNYGVELCVERVRSQIHCAKGVTATNADVAMVLTEALAKHLDPLKGGVYAFKSKDGNLVIGTSKAGFQQALAAQRSFRDLGYEHPAELKAKSVVNARGQRRDITYYDYATCVITKAFPDGTVARITGTAYFDEEFNSSSDAWVKNPKRMLDTRALCIASANAYGWGAYEPEEAQNVTGVVTQNDPFVGNRIIQGDQQPPRQVTSGASRAKAALANVQQGNTIDVEATAVPELTRVVAVKDNKEYLLEAMRGAKNRDELDGLFLQAAPELKKDPDVIAMGKAMVQHFELKD